MSTIERRPANVSLEEFEAIFESVKNWGRWGDDDIRGTLNLLTPAHVQRACGLVKAGRHVSMAIPINTVAGPDNPSPAVHHMTQMHDWDIGSGKLRFSMCYLGMESHGDCHTHIDALNHISYDGKLYGGRSADRSRARARRCSTWTTTRPASSGAASSTTCRATAACRGSSRARP